MKRILLFFLLYFLVISSFSQQGWRQGEMEAKVFLTSQQEAEILRQLRLNTELVSPDGSVIRAFLTPTELDRLKSSGLKYNVIIRDLNEHYRNFWNNDVVPPGYYTYEEIVAIADSLVTAFPSICKKVIFGSSIYNRQLAALKISDNVDIDEPEPEIMFDGGIHGDEVGGSEYMIRYARDLCLGYGSDSTYTALINNREIWLYYMVNPDGRASMSRYNAYGIDLNRDGGYMWNGEGNSPAPFSQKESKALRACMLDNQFVIYTNYHSGTVIISYPWSYRSNSTADMAHINQLAGVYSSSSGYSYLPYGQGYNVMYAINGSYKDVQYGSFGNVGWSIEISYDKQPPANQVMLYYNYNVPAMTEMINRSGYGVEGMVTDSLTGLPVPAIVWVDNYYPVYTDPLVGDYHKYVLPGTYSIRVTANGFKAKTINNVIVPASGAVATNFQLTPDTGRFAYKVITCQIPDNNFYDEGYTPGALGAPDSICYSIGRDGFITLDMGDTIHDLPGYDLRVFEGDTTAEGYVFYAGESMDGPWKQLGMGTGTTSFDLSSGAVKSARYFRIRDDGDGAHNGPNIGFDLDAIQMLHPPITADFMAEDTVIMAGTPVNFSDLSSGNPTTWHWIFEGGNPENSTLQNPSDITYDSAGLYDVTLTVSNGLSFSRLTKSDYIHVTVNTTTTEERISDDPVEVSPNPTDGRIKLMIHSFNGGTYSLYSGSGELIFSGDITSNRFSREIDLSGKHSGIYFLLVSSGERNLSEKIVVY